MPSIQEQIEEMKREKRALWQDIEREEQALGQILEEIILDQSVVWEMSQYEMSTRRGDYEIRVYAGEENVEIVGLTAENKGAYTEKVYIMVEERVHAHIRLLFEKQKAQKELQKAKEQVEKIQNISHHLKSSR